MVLMGLVTAFCILTGIQTTDGTKLVAADKLNPVTH